MTPTIKKRVKGGIHYVDNKLLNEAMIVFVNDCRAAESLGDRRPKIPEYIGVCIYKIANRLSTALNFSMYTYRDEMVGDGIEVCMRYLHNFNPEKSTNPFAYFTQIIYFAFLQRIKKEKKQAYIKAKSFETSAIMNELVHDPSGAHYAAFYAIDSLKLADLERQVMPKKNDKLVEAIGIEKLLGEDNEL